MSTRTTIAAVLVAASALLAGADDPPPGDQPLPALAELHTPGLEHVFEIVPGVWSGSGPDTDAAFDSLRALGIKTVISVDGAVPRVESLGARGMRSVHIPIRYSGLEPDETLALAKAVRDLPRPIYIHCHHGRHRGPTAVAVALICTGEIDNERGGALQHLTGTSPSYPGLLAAVELAGPVQPGEIDAFAVEFVPVHTVGGWREAMSRIDQSWDALKAIRDAGWATPEDQPDLVPAAEAGMLHDAFRQAAETDGAAELRAAHAEDFQSLMDASLAATLALEDAIKAGDHAAANTAFTAAGDTCKQCHRAYRNE